MSRAWVYLNISNPMVAWLVYRGEMRSIDQVSAGGATVLSIWHTERVRAAVAGSAHYDSELAIESRRIEDFQEKTSRLRGFYVFGDERTARVAAARWGWDQEHLRLAQIEVDEGSRMSRFDSEWITKEFPAGPGPWIDGYLRGLPRGEEPIWETIIEGRATVLDDRLRAEAKQVVHAWWPTSAPLLEISRIGFLLGSQLGLIVAYLASDLTGTRIDFALNMQDAENPEFLKNIPALLADPSCDVDRDALFSGTPEVWFTAPDLADRAVQLAPADPASQ